MEDNYNYRKAGNNQVGDESDVITKNICSELGHLPEDVRGKVIFRLTQWHLSTLDMRTEEVHGRLKKLTADKSDFSTAINQIVNGVTTPQ